LIDSSSNDETKKIISLLKKSSPFKLTYIYEPKNGFPIARNRGINAVKTQWVAFTDDDCVADSNWISELEKEINTHPLVAAFAGESKSFFKHNAFALAASINELNWKSSMRIGDTIKDFETLDNKNVVYNLAFLKKHHISYDETRANRYYGASDDCDLGMQIQKAKGIALYVSNAIIYHKDLTSISKYTNRLIDRSFAHITYENKWRSFRKNLKFPPHRRGKFLLLFKTFMHENNLSIYETISVFLVLVYTSIIVKSMKVYNRFSNN
jgi:glycosyltransferase involved in cell wall biosynthesis